MTGRNSERAEQIDVASLRPARRGRKGIARRGLALGAVALVAAIGLSVGAVGAQTDTPYSTIDPASPGADDIQTLYKLIFWMALVVFIGVQFAIVYTAMRFRRSAPAAERPAQIHGNRRLEIIWTVIPAVVLLIILIPTITTLYDQNAAAEEAGIVPGGPALGRGEWAELVLGWFPELVDARARSLTFAQIDAHRGRIEEMLKTNTVSTVHQRLRDEHGLAVGVTAFRRYVAFEFAEEVTRQHVTVPLLEVPAGEEAQIDTACGGRGSTRLVSACVGCPVVCLLTRAKLFPVSGPPWSCADGNPKAPDV